MTSTRPGNVPTAPVIVCNEVGSFPWSVLSQRHPTLIAQTRAAFDYPPRINTALDVLLHEILHGPVTPLPDTEFDARDWERTGVEHFGRSWFDAPFLWAESYFYRRLLHAVGYFHDGPWHQVDPFGPVKREELSAASLEEELTRLGDVTGVSLDTRLAAYTQASLWGNRADLGFAMSDPGFRRRERANELLVDDSNALWAYVKTHAPARIGFVTDNAGPEIVHDLVLIDHLLNENLASAITLHVKPYPYFISDTTGPDVLEGLTRLRQGRPSAAAIADRLFRAYADGRLSTEHAPLFCAPVEYANLPTGSPGDLAQTFSGSDIVILKGDLNYRRLIGDRHWHGTESFAGLVEYFPTPVATLRTVKSEVVAGLDQITLDRLAEEDPQWRGNGRHAMIQARSVTV